VVNNVIYSNRTVYCETNLSSCIVLVQLFLIHFLSLTEELKVSFVNKA